MFYISSPTESYLITHYLNKLRGLLDVAKVMLFFNKKNCSNKFAIKYFK